MEQQACTACGDRKCDCTAGLDTHCKTCKSSYKFNSNSPEQQAYQAWLNANPEPEPPAEYKRQENYPNILCQACTQCVEFSQISANNVSASDINQAQTCTANMRDKAEKESIQTEPPVPTQKYDQETLDKIAELKAKLEALYGGGSTITIAGITFTQMQVMIFFVMVIVIFILVALALTTGSTVAAPYMILPPPGYPGPQRFAATR